MLSSNAPFNEFGFSMHQRDLEQIYLMLNNAGTGSSGDGGTQDQASVADQSTGDSGGLPDLSGLATTDYVDAAIAGISGPRALYGYGSGSVTAVDGAFSASYTSTSGNITVASSGFTAPYNGIYTVVSSYIATVTNWTSSGSYTLKSAITAPYGSTESKVNLEDITLNVGAVINRTVQRTPTSVWTGYLSAGDAISVYHTVSLASVISSSTNTILISGITCNS